MTNIIKNALLLGQKLASLASEYSQDYEQRLCVLEDLVKMWEEEKQAAVVEVIEQDLPPTDMPNDYNFNMTENTKQGVLPEMQNDYLNFTDAELPRLQQKKKQNHLHFQSPMQFQNLLLKISTFFSFREITPYKGTARAHISPHISSSLASQASISDL